MKLIIRYLAERTAFIQRFIAFVEISFMPFSSYLLNIKPNLTKEDILKNDSIILSFYNNSLAIFNKKLNNGEVPNLYEMKLRKK